MNHTSPPLPHAQHGAGRRWHPPLAAGLLALAGLPLMAQDYFIVGPRAEGMGGAAVACVNSQDAQYYNPGMFGFFAGGAAGAAPVDDAAEPTSDNYHLGSKVWGVGFDANAGGRIHGNILQLAKTLSDLDIQRLGQTGIQTPSDVRALVEAASALQEIGDPGNAVTGDASAGVSMRIGHWGIGVRTYGEASSLVKNADLVDVAFGTSGAGMATAINGSGSPTDGQVLAMSNAQRDALYTSFGGAGAFNPASPAGQAVERIDFQMRASGLSPAAVSSSVTVIENAANGSAANSIDRNTTVLRLSGFALSEVPVTYGHAIDGHFSFGASLKLMVGRVYGSEISVFKDNAALELDRVTENFRQTVTWGLDLGLVGRWRYVQIGVVGRNLNRPKFSGFTDSFGVKVDDVHADPQVTAGIAALPVSWLTIALDADLIPAKTTFDSYHTQRVGLGLEINPWNAVALRAGVYQNIAESDIGPVATLGVGLNLVAVRLDLAVASSLHTVPVDGHSVPDEMRASLGLMADF